MRTLTLFKLEFLKSRRQYIFIIEAAVLAFLTAYCIWNFRDHMDAASGWMNVLYTMPLLDSLLFPLMLAALSSRLCEAEHKGHSFKLLETMQTPRSLFDAKFCFGALHIALLCLAQTAMVTIIGSACGFGALPAARLAAFTGLVFAASLMIFTMQLGLSLLLANQLIPLTVGVAGSFLGLFTMFFPPEFQRFLPWGYYGVLMQVGMDWDSETRAISFYWANFDWAGFALLGVWLIALLALARGTFARREV
jgi:hypothetical protein